MLSFILVIDFKKKAFVEKRTFNEAMIEVFGDTFGLHWFLPIKAGGFYKFYNKHILKADCNYNQSSNKNNNNEEIELMNEDEEDAEGIDKKND